MEEQEQMVLANNNLNKLWSPVLLKIFMTPLSVMRTHYFFIVLGYIRTQEPKAEIRENNFTNATYPEGAAWDTAPAPCPFQR